MIGIKQKCRSINFCWPTMFMFVLSVESLTILASVSCSDTAVYAVISFAAAVSDEAGNMENCSRLAYLENVSLSIFTFPSFMLSKYHQNTIKIPTRLMKWICKSFVLFSLLKVNI